MPKLQFSTSRYSITVPTSLVKAKGWDKGTELEWKFDNKGRLYLIAKK